MIRFEELILQYGKLAIDREKTWRLTGSEVVSHGCRRLVETGCCRGVDADGHSTIILAGLARAVGGHLDSYELDSANISFAKRLIAEHGLSEFVTFHSGDSIRNLALRKEPIDFAYFDSFDCGTGPDYSAGQMHQLAECEAVLPLLSQKAVILLDDNVATGGKTAMTMERLESRQFKCVAKDYQVLYTTESSGRITKPQYSMLPTFAVLTGHQAVYVPMAERTIYRNKAQYALWHGYDLCVIRSTRPEYADDSAHAGGFSWSRLADMLDLVQSGLYDWVWCVGADTLVTNFKLTLEEITEAAGPKKHLLICGERVAPIQADSFLVRGSPEGAAYLQDILDAREVYARHPWVENQAMIDRRERHAEITELVPQWRLNSYDYSQFYYLSDQYRSGQDCYGNRGQWIKGDFLIHWAGISMDARMDMLNRYEGMVER